MKKKAWILRNKSGKMVYAEDMWSERWTPNLIYAKFFPRQPQPGAGEVAVEVEIRTIEKKEHDAH